MLEYNEFIYFMDAMLIGYARVSTNDQNLDSQIKLLTDAGCEKIFTDKLSGTKFERPGLSEAIEFARADDTIVFYRLDRLGRSLKDLIELVNNMEQKQIALKSINDGIDTTSQSGKLFFNIFASLAEYERNIIEERTRAGLSAARARGKFGGRPHKLSKDKRKLTVSLYKSGNYSVDSVCEMMGISKPTLYKYVKLEK